jgi:hypothetical protein
MSTPMVFILLAAISATLGLILFFAPNVPPKGRDLAVGLLTSCVATLAIFALQQYIETSAEAQNKQDAATVKRQEKTAAAVAAEQSFHLSLALTSDLTGFNPEGHSMAGYYLSGKTFNSAQFRNANLHKAQLRGANLRNVDATGADLGGANLFYADLTGAILDGANLAQANLQSATLERADIEHARSLDGATVNAATCWPTGFLDTIAPRMHLIAVPILTDPARPVKASLGKTCAGG